MHNQQKKNKNLSSMIFIIILVFLVTPMGIGRAAVSLDGDVNEAIDSETKIIEEPSKVDVERYQNSRDQIDRIVRNTVLILPELRMIGETSRQGFINKASRYNIFINDYTKYSEEEISNSFSELLDGYRATRKMFYLAKDINDLASSIQTSLELINTLSLLKGGEDFSESLDTYKSGLGKEQELLEGLIMSIDNNVKMERGGYEEDINILNSLKGTFESNVKSYLGLSGEVINTAEEIINFSLKK